MSELGDKQREFAESLVEFLHQLMETYEELYFTFGDFTATTGHMLGSLHYQRLAADINFFWRGKYLQEYGDAPELWEDIGRRWEGINPDARWGGAFGDLNHFSFAHEGKF